MSTDNLMLQWWNSNAEPSSTIPETFLQEQTDIRLVFQNVTCPDQIVLRNLGQQVITDDVRRRFKTYGRNALAKTAEVGSVFPTPAAYVQHRTEPKTRDGIQSQFSFNQLRSTTLT